MIEDLSVLLNTEIRKDKIILRLDNKGMQSFENSENAISEIILKNPKFTENDSAKNLEELIGFTFEYEIYSEDNKQVFEFWGDYACDSSRIAFDSYEANSYKYTEADFCLKGKILSESFSDLYKRFNENELIFYRITNKLKTEIRDEITRFERKADFFEDKRSAFQQALKSMKRLLHILENSSD